MKKNEIPVGASTIEKNDNGQGLADWQKFLTEWRDHSAEMTAGEKRAARGVVKNLYKKGLISKEDYDDLMARLK